MLPYYSLPITLPIDSLPRKQMCSPLHSLHTMPTTTLPSHTNKPMSPKAAGLLGLATDDLEGYGFIGIGKRLFSGAD